MSGASKICSLKILPTLNKNNGFKFAEISIFFLKRVNVVLFQRVKFLLKSDEEIHINRGVN